MKNMMSCCWPEIALFPLPFFLSPLMDFLLISYSCHFVTSYIAHCTLHVSRTVHISDRWRLHQRQISYWAWVHHPG